MAPDPLSRGEVLELIQGLIRIPSVNPALAPDEGRGEAEIAEFARSWLTRHGLAAWLEMAMPDRPNCVAEVGRSGNRTLVLCAHLDTVGTKGMAIPPFEPTVQDGRIYGRGAYDMKGGAAAAMAAAAALASEELDGRVLVALVVDEEYESRGAENFVERHNAQGCIVTEPTEGRLILSHKGFVWAELVTEGRAAHGSRHDLGVSAIGKMSRIVAELERLDREDLRTRTHPQMGPASLHCSMIEGGVGLSTYAPDCRLKVERRTLPGETPEQVLSELQEAVERAGQEAQVTIAFDRPAMVCDRDAPVARHLREAAEEVTGASPEETGVAYWTDAALFDAAGIPTLNYGPGGAGAHEAEEWVDLDSVVQCAAVLAETARRFCRSE